LVLGLEKLVGGEEKKQVPRGKQNEKKSHFLPSPIGKGRKKKRGGGEKGGQGRGGNSRKNPIQTPANKEVEKFLGEGLKEKTDRDTIQWPGDPPWVGGGWGF